MKKINFLFNLIISLGVFMILGTAGGSDMGTVTVSEIFTFTISGISLMTVGHLGKALVNKLADSPKRAYAAAKSVPQNKIRQRNIAA